MAVKGEWPNRYRLDDFVVGDEVYLDGDYSTPLRVGNIAPPSSLAIGNTVADWRWLDVSMVPTQPRDMPWYMRETLVDRKWSSASGGAPSRAEQESRGIPQPSGWLNDRPTYNDAMQRLHAANGDPLPVWAQRGEGTPVHSSGATELVTVVVPSTPAPPVMPAPIPAPRPAPQVSMPAPPGVIISSTPGPSPAPSASPVTPTSAPAEQSPDHTGVLAVAAAVALALALS